MVIAVQMPGVLDVLDVAMNTIITWTPTGAPVSPVTAGSAAEGSTDMPGSTDILAGLDRIRPGLESL
ncbi:hypothetical protein [Thermomonospora echinospora]|uniref:hypothetical protein n=1 Tax=Thermomonospora echinospora TaxID=1992 RepID=UPI000CDE5E7B|nr:hypothetical protein [Thermomonospora echinospora]